MMNKDMNDQSTIEKNVMRRVHIMRILGLIISTAVLAILTFVLALYGIGREVWVAQVFANGPQDFIGHFTYLAHAFGHTRVIVQALALLSFAAFIYLARATLRALSSFFTPSHA